MGHINQRAPRGLMHQLELAAQRILDMRIDDGQRFIKQDSGDILARQAAPKRDLLLVRRAQPGRLFA